MYLEELDNMGKKPNIYTDFVIIKSTVLCRNIESNKKKKAKRMSFLGKL